MDLRVLVPVLLPVPGTALALAASAVVLAFPVARGLMARTLLRWLRAGLPAPAVPAFPSLRG
ncbi:hypothetical protein ABH920_000279 [Catenulispora sp. EB89]|uniref:hypothetical protein n=1 Tax=Catenulispora sp. EB89 TaxID=3156257 RepID=UPI0035132B85